MRSPPRGPSPLRTDALATAARGGALAAPGAAPDASRPGASGVALHRQLYLALRDGIASGRWPAGAALPSEEALCAQYRVSRITVRRALSDLQSHGLVERRQGLGTFVSTRVPAPRPRATLSFVDGLRSYAAETDVRVIAVERAAPPPEVATMLGLGAGEAALHAVRCRSIEATMVMLTDAWVPADLGRRITAAALRRRPLYEILMAQGVHFGRVVQDIGAKAADAREATLLGTEVGAPLLTVVRLIHDLDGRPVQHLAAAMPSDRGSVLMEITGAQINTLSAGFVVHSRGVGTAPRGRG